MSHYHTTGECPRYSAKMKMTWIPCGFVFEASSLEEAVRKSWDWYYELPTEHRPLRNFKLHSEAETVLLNPRGAPA